MAAQAAARPGTVKPSASPPAPGAHGPVSLGGEVGARRVVDGQAVGRARPQRPPTHYDPYLDGLFTYCLSVMCEHGAATAALAEALALAERQRERGRRPKDRALHRAWLYALARWVCLRRLDAQQDPRGGRAAARGGPVPAVRPPTERTAARRRAELAALAWPEAAALPPEQREALELAVRHQLSIDEVAAVVGLVPEEAQVRLSSAACEVERTRAALAVARAADCPTVSRLGDERAFRGDLELRRELVRHVDECAECRRLAERVTADDPWPGTAPTGGETLPVLSAPRAEVRAALRGLERCRYHHLPKFDRRGFPLPTRDRNVRRARLRRRAITALVVTTALAFPTGAAVLSGRGTTLFDGSQTSPVSASRGAVTGGTHRPDDRSDQGRTPRPGPTVPPGRHTPAAPGDADDGRHGGPPGPRVTRVGGEVARPHGGVLRLTAVPSGTGTVVRLTASGDAPVRWRARARDAWLRLSRTSGTLRPGSATTVTVTVDRERQPPGPWTSRVRFSPGGYVVTVPGRRYSEVFGAGPDGGRDTRPPARREPKPSEAATSAAPGTPPSPSGSPR